MSAETIVYDERTYNRIECAAYGCNDCCFGSNVSNRCDRPDELECYDEDTGKHYRFEKG